MNKIFPWLLAGAVIYFIVSGSNNKIVKPEIITDPPPDYLRGARKNVSI